MSIITKIYINNINNMESFYLFGLVIICLIYLYYYNKNNKELSWNVTSEINANCKRVCNGDKCEIICD